MGKRGAGGGEDKKRPKHLSRRIATWLAAQLEKMGAYSRPVNKQIPFFFFFFFSKLLTAPLFLVFGIWSTSLSVPKTLSTFPYLSPRADSQSSPPGLLHAGHGAQNPVSGLTRLPTSLPFATAIAPYKNQTFSDCT